MISPVLRSGLDVGHCISDYEIPAANAARVHCRVPFRRDFAAGFREELFPLYEIDPRNQNFFGRSRVHLRIVF